MVLAEEEVIVVVEQGIVIRTLVEPGFEPVIIIFIFLIADFQRRLNWPLGGKERPRDREAARGRDGERERERASEGEREGLRCGEPHSAPDDWSP